MRQPADVFVELPFPTKGIDISIGPGYQPERTTAIAQNVRGFEPTTDRQRGGSRPGLVRYIDSAINGSASVQELNSVVLTTGVFPAGASVGVSPTFSFTRYNGDLVGDSLTFDDVPIPDVPGAVPSALSTNPAMGDGVTVGSFQPFTGFTERKQRMPKITYNRKRRADRRLRFRAVTVGAIAFDTPTDPGGG